MRVKIEFEDDNAMTAEELEEGLKSFYGDNASIEVLPHNKSNEAFIYFGIQNLITLDQLELYYDFYPHLYPEKLKKLKIETLNKISKILDQVCTDIEKRVAE